VRRAPAFLLSAAFAFLSMGAAPAQDQQPQPSQQPPESGPSQQSQQAPQSGQADANAGGEALRVCSDANNLPQSNDRGEGYENKIAQAMARDMHRRLEYTWFPQRLGFVRNTLRARDEQTQQYKCDVIIGVPKGYELTATTQPYMHSTYALLLPDSPKVAKLTKPDDLFAVPKKQRDKLRIGVFARSPGSDWLQSQDMIPNAEYYAIQSGDPKENPATIIGRDLAAGRIDAAIVWGPVAAWLAREHGNDKWRMLPFPPHPQIHFDFELSMGTRFGEKPWKDEVDAWIAGHRDEIRKILEDYGIPLVEGKAASESRPSAPPQS
jgi:quinoprotein dehydrogenase-associated probable ABC transporter substrate-binding protein